MYLILFLANPKPTLQNKNAWSCCSYFVCFVSRNQMFSYRSLCHIKHIDKGFKCMSKMYCAVSRVWRESADPCATWRPCQWSLCMRGACLDVAQQRAALGVRAGTRGSRTLRSVRCASAAELCWCEWFVWLSTIHFTNPDRGYQKLKWTECEAWSVWQ